MPNNFPQEDVGGKIVHPGLQMGLYSPVIERKAIKLKSTRTPPIAEEKKEASLKKLYDEADTFLFLLNKAKRKTTPSIIFHLASSSKKSNVAHF